MRLRNICLEPEMLTKGMSSGKEDKNYLRAFTVEH